MTAEQALKDMRALPIGMISNWHRQWADAIEAELQAKDALFQGALAGAKLLHARIAELEGAYKSACDTIATLSEAP